MPLESSVAAGVCGTRGPSLPIRSTKHSQQFTVTCEDIYAGLFHTPNYPDSYHSTDHL